MYTDSYLPWYISGHILMAKTQLTVLVHCRAISTSLGLETAYNAVLAAPAVPPHRAGCRSTLLLAQVSLSSVGGTCPHTGQLCCSTSWSRPESPLPSPGTVPQEPLEQSALPWASLPEELPFPAPDHQGDASAGLLWCGVQQA